MTEATNGARVGTLPLAEVAAQSGLDFLAGIMAGRFPAPPITEALGFALVAVERGRAVFAGAPSERLYNPVGSIHAGFAATLLDSAMGCAVHSTLPAGQLYTTVEFKMNFLRSLAAGTGRVEAEGRVINVGRRVGVAEARLTDAAGRLYAHATTTCLIFPVDEA
jgi:uncharacterized protein (TIGR00369 family)